ncbi:MAG TPA: hypothetical protein VN730_08760 [Steroidobacteraceae bacterium]|nr:hypothetical protein [Steroidobacteraceae bacterium]
MSDPALAAPLGRFHELSLSTPDIRRCVEFYERLGFAQALTGDVWTHPYGALTADRIVIGLHQNPARESSVTWVRPEVERLGAELERHGYVLEYRRTGTEEFHEIALRDPAGQLIRVLEARTYSPPAGEAPERSLCGEFAALALRSTDFATTKRFWEPLGFVALEERESPFEHLALTGDRLNLVFHRVRALGEVALIFAPDVPGESSLEMRLGRLSAAGVEPLRRVPAELDPETSALIESPAGTRLLLLDVEL